MFSVLPIVGRFNHGSLGRLQVLGIFDRRVSPLTERKFFCLVFRSSRAVSPSEAWGQMQVLCNFDGRVPLIAAAVAERKCLLFMFSVSASRGPF